MQDAEELFYQAMQLYLRANKRAAGEGKADLQRQYMAKLRRVLEVDPHHAAAQFNLGHMHHYGEGVVKDAVQAVSWYRKAAEQGHADAQCNLGNMYCKGEGFQQNIHEAARWWQKAADQGQVNAHFGLGQLNEHHGKYQAAIVHYRAGQAAVDPEEARTRIRRCVVAVVRAKQQEQKQEQETRGAKAGAKAV
jgi:TPR repeat protein